MLIHYSTASTFSFYEYSFDSTSKDGKQIESLWRRKDLFMKGIFDSDLLADMSDRAKNDLKRLVFFAGSFCYSGVEIPGLEKEKLIVDGSTTDGDTMRCAGVKQYGPPTELKVEAPSLSKQEIAIDAHRCADCTKSFASKENLLRHIIDSRHNPVFLPGELVPATHDIFLAFANLVLQRALGERLKPWGDQFININNPISGKDRSGNLLGVDVFESYDCKFGLLRKSPTEARLTLTLTVDLRAKILRTESVHDVLHNGRSGRGPFSKQEQERANRAWTGERVMYTKERKGYTVVKLDFDNSPNSLPVPDKGISHTKYFQQKGIELKYPDSKPMVVVLGRHDQSIFLPAELVCGTELDVKVCEMLPQIASFPPEKRNQAIEEIKVKRPHKSHDT